MLEPANRWETWRQMNAVFTSAETSCVSPGGAGGCDLRTSKCLICDSNSHAVLPGPTLRQYSSANSGCLPSFDTPDDAGGRVMSSAGVFAGLCLVCIHLTDG